MGYTTALVLKTQAWATGPMPLRWQASPGAFDGAAAEPRRSLAFAEPCASRDAMRAPEREQMRPAGAVYSTNVDRPGEFVALGQPGSSAYVGLETFENPGVSSVEMTSDELTAMCPITEQPDIYTATIEYEPAALCLESKSLKLYLASFRNEGAFCEALAVRSATTLLRRSRWTRRTCE